MNLAKTQIAKQFSRAASTYDDVATLQREMADRLLERMPLSDVEALVDLGCGTGYALEQLASNRNVNGIKLIGIDIAPGMIEMATEKFAKKSFSDSESVDFQVEFEVGDIESLKLKTDSVNVAFSNAAIQWCDLAVAFPEISRTLKPHGLLLASTFGQQTLAEWKTGWREIGDENQRVHDFDSVAAIREALEQAGYNQIEIESEVRQLKFNSVKEMFRSIKQLGATNASGKRPQGMLGRQTLKSLTEHFENKLAEDGFLANSFECIFISARNRK